MFFALIKEATVIFDARDNNLKRKADGFTGFFSQGAMWMYDALKVIRSSDFPMPLKLYNFHGALKYTLSLVATLIPITLAIKFNAIWMLFLVPFFFYWVEAQFVFLFPLLIDNCSNPYLKSFELTRRCGGASAVMLKVMPIAAVMLVGGFLGMGFRRSWCLGCLSILLWYEKIKMGFEFGIRKPLECRTVNLGATLGLQILYMSDVHLGVPHSKKACETNNINSSAYKA